jgi:hypothetical protein
LELLARHRRAPKRRAQLVVNIRRLQADPLDFSRLRPGAARVFMGDGWRTGEVVLVRGDHVLVSAPKAGSTAAVEFSVWDPRNVEQGAA